jgi:hypothetical protein
MKNLAADWERGFFLLQNQFPGSNELKANIPLLDSDEQKKDAKRIQS